ncbi:hypothetical protein GS532_30765 [Rhodococcus hoagii]|nr:hypothetical protein [Prescottella equi]
MTYMIGNIVTRMMPNASIMVFLRPFRSIKNPAANPKTMAKVDPAVASQAVVAGGNPDLLMQEQRHVRRNHVADRENRCADCDHTQKRPGIPLDDKRNGADWTSCLPASFSNSGDSSSRVRRCSTYIMSGRDMRRGMRQPQLAISSSEDKEVVTATTSGATAAAERESDGVIALRKP